MANTAKAPVVAVPALDLRSRVPVKELRESPIERDFDFYIQDVMQATNDRGSLPRYREESLENYMSSAEICLDLDQMEKDFNAVRCGDKKWQDVSSYDHCHGKLLLDSERECSKKDARDLSKSVREMLEEEVRFEHLTEDCCEFIFWRRRYTVGARQYEAIKLLIERAKEGKPDVPDKDILKKMGREGSRLRNSLKRTGLWGTLIISKKKGYRRLALYPKKF